RQRAKTRLQAQEQVECGATRRDQLRVCGERRFGERFAQRAPVRRVALRELETGVDAGEVAREQLRVELQARIVEIAVQQRPQRIEIVDEMRRRQPAAQRIETV